ncbi:hypothetical protein, partial [Mycolicibacterium sp. J2]|uniref:hypothetical protein n=1 Tax=Mycolicibacterium sp. J2 TaxID=2993511 RepID=UPI00224B279E
MKVPSGQAQKKVDEEIRQRELDRKLAEEKNVMDFRMKRRDQRFTLLGLATTAMVGIAGIAVPPITTTIQSANDRAIAEAKAAREQVRGAYAAFLDSTNKFVVAERVLVDSLDQCRIVPDIKRLSRVPWNFGGGPVSIRLRSPDHCARRVRQIGRTHAQERRAVPRGAGD